MTDLTQMDKLEIYLKEHHIPYDRIDKLEMFEETPHGKYITQCEQHQIIVPPQDKERQWDVICHRGSYGHEEGLLELMGIITRVYGVEGWLTADDVIERIEGVKE